MTNSVAVIVGAGPGLGASAARAFGRAGYDVALIARNEGRLTSIGEGLQADGITTGWTTADIADSQGLTEAIQRLGQHAGHINVLHYNAVASRAARPSQLTAAELLEDLAVGTAGLLDAAAAARPLMPAGSCILATGSLVADRPMASAASLGVQKAALRNLVVVLDRDARKAGVRAATVTVRGTMAAGTPFDPDRVAAVFVALAAAAAEAGDDWRPEVPFDGDTDPGVSGAPQG